MAFAMAVLCVGLPCCLLRAIMREGWGSHFTLVVVSLLCWLIKSCFIDLRENLFHKGLGSIVQ